MLNTVMQQVAAARSTLAQTPTYPLLAFFCAQQRVEEAEAELARVAAATRYDA